MGFSVAGMVLENALPSKVIGSKHLREIKLSLRLGWTFLEGCASLLGRNGPPFGISLVNVCIRFGYEYVTVYYDDGVQEVFVLHNLQTHAMTCSSSIHVAYLLAPLHRTLDKSAA